MISQKLSCNARNIFEKVSQVFSRYTHSNTFARHKYSAIRMLTLSKTETTPRFSISHRLNARLSLPSFEPMYRR